MSQLFNHLENFLTLCEFKSHIDDQKLYLFYALNKRGLYNFANNYASKLRLEWKGQGLRDHSNINRILQLNHAQYLSNNPIKGSKKINLLAELMRAYNSQKELLYNYYTFLLHNQKSLNNNDKIELSIDKYNSYFNYDSSTLTTLRHLIDILADSEDSFNYLFEELSNKKIKFSDELAIITYGKCRRYVTKKISYGELKYSDKLISIFNIGIKRGYLLYNGRMSIMLFYNLFTAACAIGKVDWAKKYLNEHIHLISIDAIPSVKLVSEAEINFVEFKYFESIKILNQVELTNIGMKLQQRFLLICAYYVVHDNYSFIDSQINNYFHFFYYNKSKISVANFEGGLNLGKIIRLLVTGVNESKITDQINTEKYLTFRLRLPTIIEQRKIYAKKMGLNY